MTASRLDRAIDRVATRDWEGTLALLVPLLAVVTLTLTIIWAGAGFGYFWPAWVAFAGLVPISFLKLLPAMVEGCEGPRRRLAAHAALVLWVIGILFAIWLLGGQGDFWPLITSAILLASIAVHELVIRSREGGATDPELQQRVVDLTRTRRGALDVQAAELRRIERDLHDGAQARLVALTMQLGRAEERLGDRPEDRELIRAAREEAGAAIAELRDLARGIAPPVLADRGLVPAIEALGSRSAVPVEVRAGEAGDGRPAPAIESVAYFVAAESLTNVAKHAGGPATVDVQRDNGTLRVTVADDGPGGADPAGSGLSGLRSRVEAVDGTLRVDSSPGAGTRIVAEIPCE
jgi:signal transduction histidine kinase